jgi:hypothetical protein
MLILFKLFAFFVGVFLRLKRSQIPLWAGRKQNLSSGEEYSVFISKGKGDHVNYTEYSTELKSRSVFRLTHESWIDRVCKKIGFATELQTGDAAFDSSVYIACDSPLFHAAVKDTPDIRNAVTTLMQMGAKSLTSNGKKLTVRLPGDRSSELPIATLLVKLTSLLRAEESRVMTLRRDPFLAKAVAIEAVIWGLSAYTVLGVSASFASQRDLYFNLFPVFVKSFWVGGALTIGLVLLIRLILKGSSRSHRIIIESAIALGLSLPFAAYHIVSDVNISLDTHAPVVVERKILGTRMKTHRSRRGRSYTYHLNIDKGQKERGITLSDSVQVEREDFDSASTDTQRKSARLTVGPGYLGLTYLKDLEIFNTEESKTSDF